MDHLNIDTNFHQNCAFTVESEHDFWFLHLMTFEACFFTFEVGIIFIFVVEGIF